LIKIYYEFFSLYSFSKKKQIEMNRIFAFLYESQGTYMRKDIFPTPMVVKIYLSSSTSDYILTKIV